MDKKNVLITGASSGIGRAVAHHLSGNGMKVILVGRSKERLQQVAAELKGDCECIVCDLTNAEQIEEVFIQLKNKSIKLDGMVHSAGVGYTEPIRVQNVKNTRELMVVNVEAFLELEKHFIKPKNSHEGSGIVVMSSIASKCCDSSMSAYASAKAAINAAVMVSAKEFIKRKIRVNAILPAFVDTPMARNSYVLSSGDFEEYLEKEQPLGLIEPEQIAYLTEFLLSDKAKYITGALIPVGAGCVA